MPCFQLKKKRKFSLSTDLGSIQDVKNLLHQRNIVILMFLTEYFNVSQFAKVKVSFFLQSFHRHVQILYLKNSTDVIQTAAIKQLSC